MKKDPEAYNDLLPLHNKLLRGVWQIYYAVLFRPFAGPVFRYWRSFSLRLWGAKIGKRCSIAAGVKIWAPWNLEIGDYVAVANGANLYDVAKIKVDNHVTISQDSYICTASHDIREKLRPLIFEKITIDAFAWVCAKAIVLQGTKIGEGAVVAAGAVVTKDVEPWMVVGGNPARVIKKRVISG